MDHVSASNVDERKETDVALNVKNSEASTSESTNREAKNNLNCGDMQQADVTLGGLAEERTGPLTKALSSPDEASMLTVEDGSTLLQADDRSHGDHNRVTPSNEQPTTTTGEEHTEEKEAPELATPSTLEEGEDNQVDGPNARLDEETTGADNADAEAGEDEGNTLERRESTTSPQMPDEEDVDVQLIENKVENIGPVSLEATEPAVSSAGGSKRYLIAMVGIVVLVAVVVQHLLPPESPPQKGVVRRTDIFLRQMEKLKTQFPSQRAELWHRSKIHLLKHLQTAQPTEPVSLMLTAGVRAEQTLQCMAQGLASAFSSALNASVLHIDGASIASQDSDQVKLDIDSKLQGAFEGDKPVAVIHRFEELPPGSTLIFYRYCDHENAAYKKTFLIFTVLLGEEQEIPTKTRLSFVEEMVDDHLQKKFLSDGQPVSFDRMDIDKYGGLWSRISHLILPVAAEERMEHEGCSGT